MNTAEVACNIKARQDAEEVFALAEGMAQSMRFWEVLSHLVNEQLLPKPQPVERLPAMNNQEATRFEGALMPYGKHAGEEVCQVPCDYLLFLTEGDEFSQRLKRYVKSKRFADRQDAESR